MESFQGVLGSKGYEPLDFPPPGLYKDLNACLGHLELRHGTVTFRVALRLKRISELNVKIK